MRWKAGNRGNIEDQRARRGVGGAAPLGIGGLILVAALSYFTGTDFFSLLGGLNSVAPAGESTGELVTTPEEERMVDFVDAVANDAQATWVRHLGPRYERTVVTLFRDAVQSACGAAESATGPFYCPADQKVYLDLGFFAELSQRFGAPGDFAQAYVIAHEFGHHVQNLLGTNERVRADPGPGADSASVALELQADCYAGVWGARRVAAGTLHRRSGRAGTRRRAGSPAGGLRNRR